MTLSRARSSLRAHRTASPTARVMCLGAWCRYDVVPCSCLVSAAGGAYEVPEVTKHPRTVTICFFVASACESVKRRLQEREHS